jgi:hypothetical protein
MNTDAARFAPTPETTVFMDRGQPLRGFRDDMGA